MTTDAANRSVVYVAVDNDVVDDDVVDVAVVVVIFLNLVQPPDIQITFEEIL